MSLAAAASLTAVFLHGDERVEVADPTELVGDSARAGPNRGRWRRFWVAGCMAGDIVLMGSIIVPRPVAPGDSCHYRLGGFPELSVAFDPAS